MRKYQVSILFGEMKFIYIHNYIHKNYLYTYNVFFGITANLQMRNFVVSSNKMLFTQLKILQETVKIFNKRFLCRV